nr:hypothetical protein CFP56_07809 [Quercus suber]
MAASTQPSMGQIAQKLLEDALHKIIHETVLLRHHEHKLMLANLDPADKLPHCPNCRLPRLLDPPLAPKVRGMASDPPRDTVYCERRPWSRRPGHDIYDNPFLKSDVTGRPPTKKEREAAKNSKKDDGTPASEEANVNGTAPPSPSQDGDGGGGSKNDKPEKGEKKANKIDEKLKKGEYVPWQTCPSCKRSLLITRFAKHLEQCMGLSGRAASRNAMAKMNGSTPAGSRGATPNPGQESKNGDHDDDDGDESVTVKGSGNMKKKLLKKGLNDRLRKESSAGTKKSTVNGGTGKGVVKASKPSSTLPANRPPAMTRGSPAPSSTTEKRDREDLEEDDDEIVHVKKRQKLQRVGSIASVGSHNSSQPPASALELERMESQDGSFVDNDEGSDGGD